MDDKRKSSIMETGKIIKEIFTETKSQETPKRATKLLRTRKIGTFRIPPRVSGPPRPGRADSLKKYREHLRSVSRSSLLPPDPDDTVVRSKIKLPPKRSILISGDDEDDE